MSQEYMVEAASSNAKPDGRESGAKHYSQVTGAPEVLTV